MACDSLGAPQSRPKVLLFSAIDVNYLNDSLAQKGNVFGINGFLLAYIADWWSRDEDLSRSERALRRLSDIGTQCGVDSNFINVTLDSRELPKWDDDKAWAQVSRNLGAVAALARRTGLKGMAIDTENYHTKIWIAQPNRFERATKDKWRALVRARGAQVMHAIISEHPGIETVLLQEGAFWWYQRKDKSYEFWIDFYDGLSSMRPAGGLILATESTYSQTAATDIRVRSVEIGNGMLQNVQDRSYWKDHGSLAIGLWPLGKAYDDKSARYSVVAFTEQFNAAARFSERYVWIYGHGAAWWQMTEDEIKSAMRESRWIWGPRYQALPTIPELEQYRRVFAPSDIPTCAIPR